MKQFYTQAEAAEALSITKNEVRAMMRNGIVAEHTNGVRQLDAGQIMVMSDHIEAIALGERMREAREQVLNRLGGL
jgi:lactam utilization protein B